MRTLVSELLRREISYEIPEEFWHLLDVSFNFCNKNLKLLMLLHARPKLLGILSKTTTGSWKPFFFLSEMKMHRLMFTARMNHFIWYWARSYELPVKLSSSVVHCATQRMLFFLLLLKALFIKAFFAWLFPIISFAAPDLSKYLSA